MKFIKLHTLSGRPYYLNTEKIVTFGKNEHDKIGSVIETVNDLQEGACKLCKESPEHIVALIKEMEQ